MNSLVSLGLTGIQFLIPVWLLVWALNSSDVVWFSHEQASLFLFSHFSPKNERDCKQRFKGGYGHESFTCSVIPPVNFMSPYNGFRILHTAWIMAEKYYIPSFDFNWTTWNLSVKTSASPQVVEIPRFTEGILNGSPITVTAAVFSEAANMAATLACVLKTKQQAEQQRVWGGGGAARRSGSGGGRKTQTQTDCEFLTFDWKS